MPRRWMLFFLLTPFCRAQFEVASVKPCRENIPMPGGRKGDGGLSSPARLHLTCQTVMSLIQRAYVNFANGEFDALANTSISGGPGWIDSERYEIDARPEKPQSTASMNGPMLRALLEDRFQLKINRDLKEVPVYALTVARGGAKLKVFRGESCVAFDDDHPAPPPESGKPFPRLCGMSRLTGSGFDAFGVTLARFCRMLSDSMDRTAVDRTGMAGRFDIHMDLTAADLGHRAPGETGDPTDSSAAIRTAVQKLGLRLDSSKGPAESLYIVHVERPSGN
jgi:uncharacterized protein (TIGR03435 family)